MLTPARGLVVGDRYVLTRPLAQGGMGSVWIARHRELDVDVTVKFMMPTLVNSAELRARFEREAKVAARLRSQHVVQVLDFGIDDEMPYIAMELLAGENLADRLKREARLSLQVSAQIIGQVCKALRTAHEAGLVHRDLKPGNIFLAMKDGEEVVKVLDFGIVKDTAKNDVEEAAGVTETGVMMGSVHYMSPEQIRSSRQVDHRSDLWSVAVILYKMLTGNPPFPGTNHGDVMVRVCTDAFAQPSLVVPGLAASIDAFFVRALTRDPAGRFQSAQEMADAFSTAVAAAAASLSPHPQQWARTLPLFNQNAEFMAARALVASQKAAPRVVDQATSSVDPVEATAPLRQNHPSQTSEVASAEDAKPGAPSRKFIATMTATSLFIVMFGIAGYYWMRQSSLKETDSHRAVVGIPSSIGSVDTVSPINSQLPPHTVIPASTPSPSVVRTNPALGTRALSGSSSAPMPSSAPIGSSVPDAPVSVNPLPSAQPPPPRRNPLDIND